MPVTLTPSGGARNPFEAYVYCRKVQGVAEGLYHYSALQHSLEPVAATAPKPAELLPQQAWVDDAAAIVFLVANFDRTMWKYGQPFGYKTVLIEAGHIAQNIAVTCAKLGLTANPTLGIDDARLDKALGLAPPLQSALYALSIGHADPSTIAPNEVPGDRAKF
jgi:SagB-type dehydrogenase family enzyme